MDENVFRTIASAAYKVAVMDTYFSIIIVSFVVFPPKIYTILYIYAKVQDYMI